MLKQEKKHGDCIDIELEESEAWLMQQEKY